MSLLLAGACLSPAGDAQADERDRERFLAAERAVAAGDAPAVERALRALRDYPLQPYLEMAWAERRMRRIGDDEMASLLSRHASIPTVTALRRRWIEVLARRGRWQRIADQAPAHAASGDREPETACRVAEALWRAGDRAAAWPRVAALWPTGRSLPDACDPVLAAWREAGGLTADLAWQRAALAVRAGNPRLARYLRRYLAASDRTLLDTWLAFRRDGRGLEEFLRAGGFDDPRRRQVLMDGVERLAARDPSAAARLVERAGAAELPDTVGAALRARVARHLARAGDDEAFRWLDGVRDPRALAAGAVLAIADAHWSRVSALVAAMPAEQAAEERWRYWSARARLLAGDADARAPLEAMARERSYYGFLAARHLGLDYRLGHARTEPDPAVLDAVASRPAARRALEWHALERPVAARREWRELLHALPDAQLDAATHIAHAHGWHEAAIRSAARAQRWNDLEVRFPLAHEDAVVHASTRSGLSPARIYAVVRQESAFMEDVRSSAGALGLMQVLPGTARAVARRAGLRRPRASDLLDPDRNLLLGSLYLARLERRYAGHPVLASAAYNAGPSRVRRWQPDEAVSSEVWIETIPFRETRRYVQRVLAYQVIYAHRLGEEPPDLDDLMPPVPARPTIAQG